VIGFVDIRLDVDFKPRLDIAEIKAGKDTSK
jgi:hypothetical protein